MKRGTWLENTRRNPREALEAELSVMVAGLVIAFVGGSAIFAGFVNRGGATNAQSLWGTVVFVVGLLFIVLGLPRRGESRRLHIEQAQEGLTCPRTLPATDDYK